MDRNFKLSDVDKIFGTLPIDITMNTVILAAKGIFYRNGQIVLVQVRRKLYNQMIKEKLLAKLTLDKQIFHKKWDSTVYDICNYRLPTVQSMSVWLCML